MLLTIHNLPLATRYADIKTLLQSKCGIQHVILDNLIGDGEGKKVTVGVAEDADAAILVRKINGLYWNEHQLYVEDVRQQKAPSEQPFRSQNPQVQQQMELPYSSMNLQQNSSYPSMAASMVPVQPIAVMYPTPDYTNQCDDYGNYGQNKGGKFCRDLKKAGGKMMKRFSDRQARIVSDLYDMSMKQDVSNLRVTVQVQSAYVGFSGYAQNSMQVSQFGMDPQCLQPTGFIQSDNRSGWTNNYNENENFPTDKPLFGRRSRPKSRDDWYPDQQNRRQESPLRDGSGDNRESWSHREAGSRGPTQPDFRANVRPTQPEFRSNIRANERSGLGQSRPDFRSNVGTGLEKPLRREFGSNDQGSNQFSGKPTEFSRRPNDIQGRQNEFIGKSNEFSGRPNVFSRKPNDIQGRLNNRPEPSRPNERGDFNRSDDRANYNRSNERPSFGPPHDRPGVGRPIERSSFGRPNERPGFGRSNERPGFGPSNDRPGFGPSNYRPGRPNERPEFSRRGTNDRRPDRSPPRSDLPESRKRRFEETQFGDRRVERPERISRPDDNRQPAMQVREHFSDIAESLEPKSAKVKSKSDKKKYMRQMVAVKIRSEMMSNLGVSNPDTTTRKAFNKLIFGRLNALLKDKAVEEFEESYAFYRKSYPESTDKAAYETVLKIVRIGNRFDENRFENPEVLPVPNNLPVTTAQAASKPTIPTQATPKPVPMTQATPKPVATTQATPKPVAKAQATPKPVTKAQATPKPVTSTQAISKPATSKPAGTFPLKLTKGERKAKRNMKQANQMISQGKIPPYPLGDKSKVAKFKQEEKIGYIPEVEPLYQVPIEEETNAIIDLFTHEFNNIPDKNTRRVYSTVKQDELKSEIKKLLTQNLARRITNYGLKVVRIYGCPKLPTKEVIEKFLLKLRFGVQSLRKSEKNKMYTASVDTYRNYDRLCSLGSVVVKDGNTLLFKAFHTVPKKRADQASLKQMRNQTISEMIDRTDLNLLDKDWPAKQAEIDAQKATKQALEAILAEDRATIQANNEEDKKLEDITPIPTKTENDNGESSMNDNEVVEDNLKENDISNNQLDESKDDFNQDFHVIDEVNELDSDIDRTACDDEAVNDNDEGNDAENHLVDSNGTEFDEKGNDVENNEKDEDNPDIGMDDADVDMDDVDIDIDDVDEDDLEDY